MRYNIWAAYCSTATGWGAPELIELDNAGSAVFPKVATTPSGAVIAIWSQYDGIRNNIWSAQFTALTGWQPPEPAESDSSASASSPSISVNPLGNAMAIWSHGAAIWGNRYVAGSGWTTAEPISSSGGAPQSVRVAMDPQGNATAVWMQNDGTRSNIHANRFSPASGWAGAQLLEVDNSGGAEVPDVAMDAFGNAIAVWHQSNGVLLNIWAARYEPLTGWLPAFLIENNNSSTAFGPQVSMNAAGDAMVVWRQPDGTVESIWSAVYR